MDAIIDTGACRTLISKKLVEQLELQIIDKTCSLKVIDDKLFNTIEACCRSVKIDGIPMRETEFLVLPPGVDGFPVVLGADFVSKQLEVSVADRRVTQWSESAGRIVYFEETGDPKCRIVSGLKCFAASNIKIGKGTTNSVPLYYSDPHTDSEHVLLYTDKPWILNCSLG